MSKKTPPCGNNPPRYQCLSFGLWQRGVEEATAASSVMMRSEGALPIRP